MYKSRLVGLVSRCEGVVRGEVALLRRWGEQSGLPDARRRGCTGALGLIQGQLETPLSKIERLCARASALNEDQVVVDVSREIEAFVLESEESLARRGAFEVATLPGITFDIALSLGPVNAEMAARNAQLAIERCIAGAAPP